MNLQTLKTPRALRSALTLVALATGVLLASPAAQAAGPRPLFQMPFPCGQTWAASTYPDNPDTEDPDGHWPDYDSIDLGQWDEGDNISEGEPVLASAAGTVSQLITLGERAYTVLLDHGGGWGSYYVHIETLPPLSVGDKVAQGEQIGRTFNSGADDMHLHYTQMRDGQAVRIAFNGELIDTHAGNEASYYTWGTDDAEELTSLNCPGNSFMGFNQNGMHYELLYKPGSGDAKIVRLDADGTGVTTTYSAEWTRGYTHLTPFYLVGGQQHAFLYKSSSGYVKFVRLNSQGGGVTTLSSGTWGKGWTHFVPFSIGGHPYYLAYNSLYGYANIERINPEGNGSTTLSGGTWTKGWTQIVAFTQYADQYLFLYKGGSGAVKIMEITGSGNDVDLTEVYSGTWTKGWTNLTPLSHAGARYLLGYKAASGRAAVMKVKANAQGVDIVHDTTWTKPWTAFSPLLLDGKGAVLIYKAGSGTVKTVKLKTGGAGTTTIWTGSWTTGWA